MNFFSSDVPPIFLSYKMQGAKGELIQSAGLPVNLVNQSTG